MERTERRWWTWTVTLLAGAIVAGALLSAVFQLAMLAVPAYREEVADLITRAAGRPVDIGGVSLGWHRFSPQLEVADITVYSQDGSRQALAARRLRLRFPIWRLLQGEVLPSRVVLTGLQLSAQIDASGRLSLRGMDSAGGDSADWGSWMAEVDRFNAIAVEASELRIEDQRLPGQPMEFRLLQAEAERTLKGVDFSASLQLPSAIGSSARIEASLEGDLAQPDSLRGRWQGRLEGFTGVPWIDLKLLPQEHAVLLKGANVQASGAIEHARLGETQIYLDAEALEGHAPGQFVVLHDLAMDARLSPEAGGWAVSVSRLALRGASGAWPQTQGRLRLLRPGEGKLDVEADLGYARLQDIAPWLALVSPGSVERLRALATLQGEARGLVLRLHRDADATRYALRADLSGIGIEAHDALPGLSGLSGELSATENGGNFNLHEGPLRLAAPALFGDVVSLKSLAGTLRWARAAQGWTVESPAFALQALGGRAEGHVKLDWPANPDESPVIDAEVGFSAEDVTRLKPLMPLHWGDNLRSWLGYAIQAGRIPGGQLRMQGPLRAFPFREVPGRFTVDFDVADGRLAYGRDWPALSEISGRLHFTGTSLRFEGDSGRAYGARLRNVKAGIAEFRDAELLVDGIADGGAEQFYRYLKDSPLAPRMSALLGRTQASGETNVALHLSVPLRDAALTVATGTIGLHGIELKYEALDEPFRHITGELRFSPEGVAAEALTGDFYGVPVTATSTAQGNYRSLLRASLDYAPNPQGEGLSSLIPSIVRPFVQGLAHWRAELATGPDAPEGLWLYSDLKGMAINAPAPLAKPSAEPLALALHLWGDDQFPLRVGLGLQDRVGGELLFTRGDAGLELRRGLLQVGSAEQPKAVNDGLFIRGKAADLDLLAWSAAAGQLPQGDQPSPLRNIEVHAERAWLGSQFAREVALSFTPEPSGWRALLSGPNADGLVQWADTDGAGGRITAQLKHLRAEGDAFASQAPAATSGQEAMAASVLDPARLPVLEVAIDQAEVGAAQLGRLLFRTQRVEGGQRIDLLSSSGGDSDINGTGQWRRSGGQSSAQLDFELKTRNISELLKGLGYAPHMSARNSHFVAALRWQATAGGLDWDRADGRIDIDAEKGSLRAVEPGAGRVLGLLNFYALPRRLLLDFGDVVSQGLGFDDIKGSFELAGGDARTKDLKIAGPSVKVEVKGRVGLSARDYDQYITVYPGLSSGVTLGALLLGGPAAGALMLVAQQVLDKPLDQVTQLSYRLTGSWDNPQIKRADGSAPAGG